MRLLLAVVLLGALISAAPAAITYVDATTANTTLEDGTPLIPGSNFTSSSTEGPMDGLWHLRTGVGNGANGVWTADELASGSEDVPRLVTAISFPEPGGYRLFAYIWDSDDAGEDWDVRFRVGN